MPTYIDKAYIIANIANKANKIYIYIYIYIYIIHTHTHIHTYTHTYIHTHIYIYIYGMCKPSFLLSFIIVSCHFLCI